jgi:hypothetical protein
MPSAGERVRRATARAVFLCAALAPAAAAAESEILEFRGFRLRPPPGADWVLVERDARSVFFGKRTGEPAHTFVALAYAETLPEAERPRTLAEHFERVKQVRRASFVPGRHWFLEEDFATEGAPAAGCLRYRQKFLDTGTRDAPGIPLPLEVVGFSCVHPDSLAIAIHVHYEERGLSGAGTASLRDEGEAFLRSFEFAPLEHAAGKAAGS